MNDGLVLLVAWGQWLAIVLALVLAVARHVADAHDDGDATYRRPSGDGGDVPPT